MMYNTNGQGWAIMGIDIFRVLPFVTVAAVSIALIAYAFKPSKSVITDSIQGLTDNSYNAGSVGDKAKDALQSF